MGSYFSKKTISINKRLIPIISDYVSYKLPFIQELEKKTIKIKHILTANRFGYHAIYYYNNYYIIYTEDNYYKIRGKSEIKNHRAEWKIIEYI